jgi:hypothetical protein
MAIARDIDAACRALGVAVTGGHTEVTDAVTRPVVAGDMQGPPAAGSSTSPPPRPSRRVLYTSPGSGGGFPPAPQRGEHAPRPVRHCLDNLLFSLVTLLAFELRYPRSR